MSSQAWWYAARATGYVAWALLTASVVSGLLFSTRLAKRRVTPAWMLDLHRFLGGASVGFIGVHLLGLVADTYVHFGAADLLIPLASSWRREAVALGVVALYLVMAVEVSSLLMRRLPRHLWRTIHLGSYGAFWLATFHLLTAGTDSGNPLSQLAATLAIALVVFLSLLRALEGRGADRSRRPSTGAPSSPGRRGVSSAQPAGSRGS